MVRIFGAISTTAYLKVENSAQTTSRFFLISYCAPQSQQWTNIIQKAKTWAEFSTQELANCLMSTYYTLLSKQSNLKLKNMNKWPVL
jgi:hypothetical protein